MSNASSDETDRRLNLTVGLIVVIGAGCAAWAIWALPYVGGSVPWIRILAVAAMLGLSDRAVIHIRIKDSRHTVGMEEPVVLVGLMLLPGPWLVLSTAVAIAVARAATRRAAPIKQLFNTAKTTAVVAAAVAAAAAFGLTGPFSANRGDLPGIIAAALAIIVADEILALPVIALATRTRLISIFLTNADVRLGGMVVRLALASFGLFWFSRYLALIAVVPLIIIGLHIVAANQVRARAERAAWQKLAQATDEFNEVDLDAVLSSAVTRASELFSSDDVEVEITNLSVPDRLVRGGAAGIGFTGEPEAAPPSDGHVIATPLESHGGTSAIGELRLRFRGKVTLSEREEYTLRTFAAALCTAVRNAAAFAETQRLAEHHAYAASHDPLTGLANRRHLYERGAGLLSSGAKGQMGLLLVDLNHFKEINDTLGHAAGDQVLAEVARRLAAAAATDDLVVRLGGDEFAVLFSNIAAPALALPRANAVLAGLNPPIEVDGMRIVVEASAGVALAPFRGGVEELLRRADVAMYQAKREGRTVEMYARSRDTADIGRLALSAELSRAVAEHEFTVNFQPVVDLATGEVISAEALARWHHPRRGDLNPNRFLDYVERSGLLAAFSEAVFDQALRAAATWNADGFAVPVAVNVSPRSLLDPTFPESVQRRLELAAVPAETLIIELTESLTLSQLDVVDEVLCALRDLGIRLALDDFGTGYSSLATLARIPVHELKIDREFVAAMEGSAEAAVVRSTIELGRSLDLLVVAEGVESEQQRGRLWELGCPAGQGHLFARPMPIHRLLATLRRGYEGRPGALAPSLHESGAVIRMPFRRTGARSREDLG
ncbi:MAG TPA: bifunctional diguanylate cyclase/phosphodiesterase [Rugosimonospora sp.]